MFVLTLGLSLICEVDLIWVCALPLSVEVVFVERGVVYSQVVFTQILSGGSLCGKSYVDELVEILLCEGGDVELGARILKHIFVFAIDPLSLTLSLSFILYLASFILLIHTYMLGIIVCVPYLC